LQIIGAIIGWRYGGIVLLGALGQLETLGIVAISFALAFETALSRRS